MLAFGRRLGLGRAAQLRGRAPQPRRRGDGGPASSSPARRSGAAPARSRSAWWPSTGPTRRAGGCARSPRSSPRAWCSGRACDCYRRRRD